MLERQKIDGAKLEAFVTRAIGDLTAGYTGVMVSLGSKLGLYRAMAGAGPLSATEIALRAGCFERYVAEWLNAQAAGGYIAYHALSDTYELLPEQAMVLADEDSPVYIPHAWNVPASLWFGEERALEAFRTGKGIAWGEHDGRLSCGSAAFYRNGYRASLVPEWLPALDGVVARLESGMEVADVGCGHGHSTLLMAEAFPKSRFHGFDTHPASLEEARQNAMAAGLPEDRIAYALARADEYPDRGYGLICFFDILHDLGDPVAAARYAAKVLAPGGTVLLVEPFAHDHIKDNLSPVAQVYYSASTLICCAHAISEGGNLVLGAQAGQARLADVFRKAGFTHFRRAAETPFNLIFEVRR
ncbi:MAG: class I SAM-dependent methyltransferase [Alphaproteobacteria bacterium]|nr:class I SAM-dependent methyltransferase [Alphaproteobacteria bacterium]MBU0797338.1 class I SAM-dependent methyltransferase [Alphaproteobacteria bacterium]MBU0886894.1 class I SAM-dependent methyltransferase [Alphaproteobacteria bacterium]MBU1812363.1 class I SAM-dependent methyltransferase [Alphaproteobacteria bacterium]MBU2092137.1 class I SAM-dependent methyltransferase [Alphaproteobacteria bacterium]